MDGLGLGSTWLVVLQAEPLAGPPRALGDLAPGFRALAREAVEAGAGVAIVIPTSLTRRQPRWSLLPGRGSPGETQLLTGRPFALAGKAKKLCYVEDSPDGEQPALDVLVYARAAQYRKGP